MQKQLKLEFTLEKEEYYEFQATHSKKSNMWSIGVALLLFLASFGSLLGNFPIPDMAIWFIFVLGSISLSNPLNIKNLFEKSMNNNQAFWSNQIYTIESGGITIDSKWETSSSSSFYSWDKFHKMVEADDAFYLYATNMCSYILPKRAFVNEEATSLFLDFCQENIGKREWRFRKKSPYLSRLLDFFSNKTKFRTIVIFALVGSFVLALNYHDNMSEEGNSLEYGSEEGR